MMVYLSYHIENISFLMASLGRQHILASLLGLLAMLCLTRLWRNRSALAHYAMWVTFVVWLALAATLLPAVAMRFPALNHFHLWMPLAAPHPCDIPVYERFSNVIPFLGPMLSWQGLLFGFWGSCVALLAWRRWSRRRYFRQILRRAEVMVEPGVLADAERWRNVFGIRRRVSLRHSDELDQPFTIGVLCPTVFIPDLLLQRLEPEQLAAVIGHEFAHIKRLDDLWLNLQHAVQAVFCFSPTSWWFGRNLYELRERCCDALAVRRGRLDPRKYSQALLEVASIHQRGDVMPELAFGSKTSVLEQRIRGLVVSRERAGVVVPVLGTLCVLTLISLMAGFRPSANGVVLPLEDSRALLAQLRPQSPLTTPRVELGVVQGPAVVCWIPEQRNYAHPALDLAYSGDPSVRAIAAGVVDSVVTGIGHYAGTIVRIRHDHEMGSSYAHLHGASVKPGQRVEAGSVIGTLSPGRTVHFEVTWRERLLNISPLAEQFTGGVSHSSSLL